MYNHNNKVYGSLPGAINVLTTHVAGFFYVCFLSSSSIKGENAKRRTAGMVHRFYKRGKREMKNCWHGPSVLESEKMRNEEPLAWSTGSINRENVKRRTAGALHRFHNREKREMKPR